MGFQQGLSGLNAASKNLEVIGNNVANANTIGAKESRAEFGDMYASAISNTSIGIGVNLQAVTQQFTQGNITTTDSPLDLAINGNGFFEVQNPAGQTLYTRNGQFQQNKDGFITTNTGLKLMGYPASNDGTIQPGAAVPLQLPTGGVAPNPTGKVSVEMNLDARKGTTNPTGQANAAAAAATAASTAAAAAAAADPTNAALATAATNAAAAATAATTAATAAAAGPQVDFTDAKTYNDATSVTVFDAKGQDVALTYYFQKAADDTWNVFATANGTSVKVDGSGNPLPVTTINFPADGGKPTAPVGTVAFDVPSTTNATGGTTLPITGVALDLTGATQYGSGFGVTSMVQDGYAAGQLVSVAIEKSGVVTATYSNGQSKAAGQLELATFRNPQGLSPLGGNLWARSYASGDPTVGTPSSGNIGALQAGALEESNTDLTNELVNMITAQRIYQANSQTIKTQDQVLQTLVNLR